MRILNNIEQQNENAFNIILYLLCVRYIFIWANHPKFLIKKNTIKCESIIIIKNDLNALSNKILNRSIYI